MAGDYFAVRITPPLRCSLQPPNLTDENRLIPLHSGIVTSWATRLVHHRMVGELRAIDASGNPTPQSIPLLSCTD